MVPSELDNSILGINMEKGVNWVPENVAPIS